MYPYPEEIMSKQFEVYLCEKCQAGVEVLQGGAGGLVCCGAPMKHLAEGVTDAAKEKHVPVAEKTGGNSTRMWG